MYALLTVPFLVLAAVGLWSYAPARPVVGVALGLAALALIAAQWTAHSIDAAKPRRSACWSREAGRAMSSLVGWCIGLK